jgi:hypothetical protein
MSDIKQLTLEEAKNQLRMNLSLIEMLKGNTPIEIIAMFREKWVEPLEELIEELSEPPKNPRKSSH